MVVYSDKAKGYASNTATNRASKPDNLWQKSQKDKHLCRVKPTLLREQTLKENCLPGWGLCRRVETTPFKTSSFEEN
jgi:hypothetical protein